MVHIRPALASDRDAACRFLYDNMNSRISLEHWRRITDGRWARDLPEFGMIAEDSGRIVGFVDVIYAERVVAGQRRYTGNLGALYVEREFRRHGLALDLLRAVTARDDVTYTTFSSNPPAVKVVLKAGFEPLDDKRLLWRPGGEVSKNVEVIDDVAGLADQLSSTEQQVLSDHAGMGLDPFVIRDAAGAICLVVLYVKMKGEDVAYHEVLHVSDVALFSRHVGNFAAHILPAGKSVLSVDSRFVTDAATPDVTEEIPVPRHYRPAGMAPADVDFLYSETVLLSLKLY